MSVRMLFLVVVLPTWIDAVYGQIGVTTCTFSTQTLCPANIPLSYCDVAAGKCSCATAAGYVDDGTGFACVYDCGILTAPTNDGRVSTSTGTTTGKIATYSCSSGYKIVGNTTRTCIQDSGWSNLAPTCTAGSIGDNCSTNTNLCILIAYGTCLAGTCQCQAGYKNDGTNKTCIEIKACLPLTPCQNGGTCIDLINLYICACAAGYTGTNCSTNINECASAPCQNGGTCNDGVSSYTCTCAAGYTGTTCTTNINECASTPCQNGGSCTDLVNGYTCACITGYTGTTCATYFDVCLSSQCQNGARCLDLINNYSCACVAGFTGKNCQTNINDCAVNNCSNGATCVDGINNYTCSCAPGYNGTFCNNNIDECIPPPCVNGGTCIDGINGYSCNCLAGYTGKTCATGSTPKVCNENEDERGTVWPGTFAGNTLFKSCLENFTGNVSRVCNSDAEWKLPKYTCIRATVLDATTKVFGLSTQSTDVEIIGAVKQLMEAAKQTTTSVVFSLATDAEVFELSTALNFVAELVPANSLAATNDFIDSASSLVDQQHLNSWQTLEYWCYILINKQQDLGTVYTEEDSFGADQIMDALEKVANKSTLIDHSILTTNIAYKKQNTTIKDVSFPRETDGGWLDDSRGSIYVSFSSALDSSEEVTSFGLLYKNLTGILRASGDKDIGEAADIVNGPVVSLTLVSPPTTPVAQVTVIIEHSVKTGYSMPRCSFWKVGKDNVRGSWSMDGCMVSSSNATVTVCTCNHLTNFAVLMSPFVQVDTTSEILRVASIVGMCISLLFLLITLLTHCCLYRYLRSDRVTHLINFCTALFVSYVIFLTGIDRTESRDICIFITSVLHYIYLVVFFLMLVGGIDVCYSVTFIFSKRLRMRCLLIAAWVLPAVIVGISLGITRTKGYGNSSFCWLSLEEGLIWAFVGPALAVITLNLLFLAITIYKLFQARTMKEKSKLDQINMSTYSAVNNFGTTVRALCVLVPVMGISWIVGIFYVHKDLYWIQFVFAICNGLQGFFVFLFHCAFNTQVKNAVKAKARKYSTSKMTSELQLSQRNDSGSSPRANFRVPSNDEFSSEPVGQRRCQSDKQYYKY